MSNHICTAKIIGYVWTPNVEGSDVGPVFTEGPTCSTLSASLWNCRPVYVLDPEPTVVVEIAKGEAA